MNDLTHSPARLNPVQPTASPPTWTVAAVAALFELPFNELLFRAQQVHREQFPDADVELATLLSIKTGGCPEDCAYCPQAARYHTGVAAGKLLPLEEVVAAARAAKQNGATRFCMGAAWKGVREGTRAFDQILEIVRGVHALGLESCVTLGQLTAEAAHQ